jgi:hypothetical protein
LDGRLQVTFDPEGSPSYRILVDPLDPEARRFIEALWEGKTGEEG